MKKILLLLVAFVTISLGEVKRPEFVDFDWEKLSQEQIKVAAILYNEIFEILRIDYPNLEEHKFDIIFALMSLSWIDTQFKPECSYFHWMDEFIEKNISEGYTVEEVCRNFRERPNKSYYDIVNAYVEKLSEVPKETQYGPFIWAADHLYSKRYTDDEYAALVATSLNLRFQFESNNDFRNTIIAIGFKLYYQP